MRKKILCVFAVAAIALACSMFIIQQARKPINPSTLVANTTKSIKCEEQISFESFGEGNFTCTGLTYDPVEEAFWIADYGKLDKNDKLNPRIVEISSDLKGRIAEIELSGLAKDDSFNLQGIAYDNDNNSLWIAIGDSVIELDKNGSVLNEIPLGKYARYKSNGIAVNGDNIWVLCYEKYLLKYSQSGNLLKEYAFNFADQDQIVMSDGLIHCTIGADYSGNNNFVFTFNPETEEILNKYIVEDSHSVEGIAIVNNEMYIANDGTFHKDVLGISYISKYLLH